METTILPRKMATHYENIGFNEHREKWHHLEWANYFRGNLFHPFIFKYIEIFTVIISVRYSTKKKKNNKLKSLLTVTLFLRKRPYFRTVKGRLRKFSQQMYAPIKLIKNGKISDSDKNFTHMFFEL